MSRVARGRGAGRALLLAMGLALAAGSAHARPLDPAKADETVTQARAEGDDAFCKTPETPLSAHARSLCPLAHDVKGCEGFVKACEDDPLAKPIKPTNLDLGSFGSFLSMLANGLVWLLIAAAVGLIVWFIVNAILKAQRDRQAADKPPATPARVIPDRTVEALEATTDAELLLRRADDHARRGELDRAAALYLAASLRALDRRGAIRLARHRTNGEYVRGCKDPEAKPELRAIVREVDRVQYGHESPTPERLADVASRATALVTKAAAATLLALALVISGSGCAQEHGPILRSADPGGDELLFEVLKRGGADVARIGGSLATLPMPKDGELAPLVIVDASRVPLEEESRAHLARWVEAGGRLLLAGNVSEWPEELKAKAHGAESTEVTFLPATREDDESADDDGDDDSAKATGDKAAPLAHVAHVAHVARPAALAWPDSYELGTTGDHEKYAGVKAVEHGIVIGLAADDLLTNAGLARSPNAAALVALIGEYAGARKIQVALPEDGISPPSSPVSALQHAGLGLALVHALAAAGVLMLAFGIRQARARLSPPPARRAWTEHIEATGGLYARARLAPHALSAYTRFVDGRLRATMPRGMSDPSAFLALRAGADPAWCADVWGRATAARSADRPRGDELATLRQLSSLYAAAMKTE